MSEVPQLYEQTIKKAKKDHRCCECGSAIRKGDYYHHAKGLWDGEWDEYKWCCACNDLREEVLSHYRNITEDVCPFGELKEWAEEMNR